MENKDNHKLRTFGVISALLVIAAGGGLYADHADGTDDFLQAIGLEQPLGVENMSPLSNTGKDPNHVDVSGNTPSAIPADKDGLPADGSEVNLAGISPGGGLAPENHDWSKMAPMELSIPETNLVIPIVESAVTSTGVGDGVTMNLPVSYQAGWLDTSAPLNATEGTTTIAAHVNWVNGNLAPMSNIKLAKPGMIARTSDANGKIQKWRIDTVGEVVKWSELNPTFHVEKRTGGRRLVLVTCEGTKQADGTMLYDSNYVVTATPLP